MLNPFTLLRTELSDTATRLEEEAANLRRAARLLDEIAAGESEAALLERARRDFFERGARYRREEAAESRVSSCE